MISLPEVLRSKYDRGPEEGVHAVEQTNQEEWLVSWQRCDQIAALLSLAQ